MKKEEEYFNDKTTELINSAKSNKLDVEEVTKEWEKLIREVTY